MSDSLLLAEEAALQAQLECIEENGDSDGDDDDDGAITLEKVIDPPTKEEDTKEETTSHNRTSSKSKRRTKANDNKEGVLYIGHLGNDFQEPELVKFLSQFGKMVRLRLSRSKRTGNPKGYAFCQFPSQEIAAIVAETLQGYILFGTRRLICHVVPPSQVHDRLFFRFVFKPPPSPSQTKARDKLTTVTQKLVARERRKRKALQAMGIDFCDFPGFEAAAKETTESVLCLTNEAADAATPSSKDKASKARKVSNADDSIIGDRPQTDSESPNEASQVNSKRSKRKKSVDGDVVESEGLASIKKSTSSLDAENGAGGMSNLKQSKRKEAEESSAVVAEYLADVKTAKEKTSVGVITGKDEGGIRKSKKAKGNESPARRRSTGNSTPSKPDRRQHKDEESPEKMDKEQQTTTTTTEKTRKGSKNDEEVKTSSDGIAKSPKKKKKKDKRNKVRNSI